MSDIIHLLPDTVANQIAAGEVIQRPASVVKELVENAIDAEARRIDVVIIDAGKTSIQVIDDGLGMTETDARMAFERHATSKISQAADLFALRTMGFRGEALASIAAVAQVELRTRREGDQYGTKLTIEGSQVVSLEPDACAKGSSFLVRNLFFNVPARRKFLKSNQTELSNIVQEFERVALVHPEISFSLTHNGTSMMVLPPTSLRQRIINIFGKRLNEQLLTVEVDTSLVRLTGFIGKPEAARKKGVHQYFFVNSRFMRHGYFHKAVLEAFDRLVADGEQVPYFLYFDVDPANIDVNIHPTKTEIKFENELAIWQIIVAAIREALGRFNAVPTIDFDTEGRPEDIPVFGSSVELSSDVPQPQVDATFNPFTTTRKTGENSNKFASNSNKSVFSSSSEGWESLYTSAAGADFEHDTDHIQAPEDDVQLSLSSVGMESAQLYFQFKGRYIITSVKSGLMIIEQHRAHLRVLFDRYIEQMTSGVIASQGLLFPEVIQLSPSECVILEHLEEDLQKLGLDITNLGGGSFSVNAIPTGAEGLSPEQIVRDMLHCVMEKGNNLSDEIQQRLALSLARQTAIPVGQVLGEDEMENLVDSLFACSTPNYTPDGKVIIAILQQEDVDRLFN